MKKQVLLLSVALAALVASPAFADDWTDITEELKVPIDTAHAADGLPGDITIEEDGAITVSLPNTVDDPTVAAVTINSDNAFNAVAGSSISNKNADSAVGLLVDLQTATLNSTCAEEDCLSGLTMNGTIDLTGTGETKRGLWLKGPDEGGEVTEPFHFVGDIDMTSGTITVTGDDSIGMKIDSLAELDGNLTIGAITMNQTSTTSTGGLTGLEIDGVVNGDIHITHGITVNGNSPATTGGALLGIDISGLVHGDLVVDDEAGILVNGTGAKGILITGSLDACDSALTPDCVGTGAIVNNTTIATGVVTNSSSTSTQPSANSALAIGGSIAGGIYNAGPAQQDDGINAATLASVGTAATVDISQSFQGTDKTAILIGPYQGAVIDKGFSFYNRGAITSSTTNEGDSTAAIAFSGNSSTVTTTLQGGFYNSGTVHATAQTGDGDESVFSTAINIGGFARIGPNDTYLLNGDGTASYLGQQTEKTNTDPLHNDQASFVNSSSMGTGVIAATLTGSGSGTARAIHLAVDAFMPSLINTGEIDAIATTTDTTIASLKAQGIFDESGSLQYIQNNGLILAQATTLDNDAQYAAAIDLSGDTLTSNAGQNGVLILNQSTQNTSATIVGNIIFGAGQQQIVNVLGAGTSRLATITGDITYGGGFGAGTDKLLIGDFATVTGRVTANELLGVEVDVFGGGTFNVLNDTDSGALNASQFNVFSGGTVNLNLHESFRTGIVDANDLINISSGAKLNIEYASFISDEQDFVLFSAPKNQILIPDIGVYNQQLKDELPFLFASADLVLDNDSDPVDELLLLKVVPKDADALGLTGYAKQIQPFANQALVNDDVLGAAFVKGITDPLTAQRAYNEMAPDVSGGARAIAIALTDQSSGPVATRQRTLRMYGKESGDVTLWGQEFAQFLSDPGDKDTGQTGFKDHGFGFVLGLDGGDPKSGWYGGAFTFYSGDIVESLPRDSHSNSLWYMLSGYTDWRGRGLFLDTKFDVGYMQFKSKRFIDLTIPNADGSGSTKFIDEADSKRPGIVGALGFTTGAILNYGSTTFTPQISVDGMTMRQEGYSETHPDTAPGNGKGLLLQTQSFYASSARIFLGTEVREDLNMGDFFVQPDLRLGYRYDFLNDATKLKVNFADIGTNSTPTPGGIFTVIGPDPAQGNFVAGASIAATTDAWTLGANFDFVRGTNGATTEVGTIHLLGRI